MAKNLLIVESPAKAKTIEKYLGKDFMVKSSFGHIRDLEKGKKGVDIEDGFEPSYVVSPEKQKVVKDLKAAAKKVEEVWLATDEDREGEAIAWHLCEVLGLDESTTKRIVFREITKSAILKAVEEPGKVDLDLVRAQQARRILDRLVGFELSGILWRKVKNKLSAGRVQSVAVKLIVDREREINAFKSSNYYKVVAQFLVADKNGKQTVLQADLNRRLENKEEALAFLEGCKNGEFAISEIKIRPLKRKPAAPFTTSTLQQEASRKCGFSVKRTMMIAQRLYEQGFISYMRTDSTSLSLTAKAAIQEEIIENYGANYHQERSFKSKSQNAQEAHEAIRPTMFKRRNASGDRDEQRLYELIWNRTVASQMAEAQLEKTTVLIENTNNPDGNFKAVGEVLKFDGFLKVYMESKDDDEDDEGSETKGILPPLSEGQIMKVDQIQSIERFTRGPARYTEAGLVKKLEELGIGRPSTYAPTISKIMEEARGYVTKESREGYERSYEVLTLESDQLNEAVSTEITGSTSNRLYSSDLGMVVTDFLSQHFKEIMDYGFTAEVEDRLDGIAQGKSQWKSVLGGFYNPFHERVEETIETAERAKGTRELGKDPETGHTVVAQMTRYGPVIQIGTREEVGEEGKPKFASLRVGQSIETITFEEGMKLFEFPKTIGEYEDKEVVVAFGRFGPYVKYDEKFISLPKGEDPLNCDLAMAIELIEAKRREDAPIGTYKDIPYTKGVGRFGPFLKYNGMFVNIPRRFDPDNLAVQDAHDLIEAKIQKEANRYIQVWEKEKVALENGRWGPFVRYKKKSYKIPKSHGIRLEAEDVKDMTLEEAMAFVAGEVPKRFEDMKKAESKALEKEKEKEKMAKAKAKKKK